MPLYDYKCSECGEQFEAVKKIAERATAQCPHCDGVGNKLEVAASKVILFHAGWYEHFDINPVYIDSKKKLKETCDKYGKGSAYLDDSC